MTAPQPGAPGDQMSPNSKAMIAAAVAALVLIAGGVAVYFYLRDDAPAEVDINTAVDDSSTNTTAADGTATTSAGDASIDGTWSLEPTTEELVYDKPTGSFAGFRVKEEISGIGSTEAVGRTRAVNGSVTIDGEQVTKTSFTVQMDTITTDQSMRDSRAKEALGTSEFPTATFELTKPIDLGADAASKTVSVDASGDLTIHGVTKPATFKIDAKLASGKIVMTGTADVTLSDFGVKGPTNAKILSVSDSATVEFQFFLTK